MLLATAIVAGAAHPAAADEASPALAKYRDSVD